MHIGIAGIGRMGANIGARLMEVGHKLTVWNRSADKTKPLADAGANVAKTPAELAERSRGRHHHPHRRRRDRRGLSRPARAAVRRREGQAVHRDEHRAAGGADRARRRRCAPRARPMSNARSAARRAGARGKLLGLMGAEPADAARARPILEQLCRRVLHMRPVGTGAVMKLAVNLPLMVYWQALGEAFAHVRDLGWEPSELLDFRPIPRARDRAQAAHAGHDRDELKNEPVRHRPRSASRHAASRTSNDDARPEGASGAETAAAARRRSPATRRPAQRASGNDEVSTLSVYWADRKQKEVREAS